VEVFLVTGQKIIGVLNRNLISEVFLSRGILIWRFDCSQCKVLVGRHDEDSIA
jgi:hypothetical protein